MGAEPLLQGVARVERIVVTGGRLPRRDGVWRVYNRQLFLRVDARPVEFQVDEARRGATVDSLVVLLCCCVQLLLDLRENTITLAILFVALLALAIELGIKTEYVSAITFFLITIDV